MRVCVDTTILLDILKDEFRSFQDKLYSALAKKENLVAPSVVFTELMPQFGGNNKQVREFLEEHKIANSVRIPGTVYLIPGIHKMTMAAAGGTIEPFVPFYGFSTVNPSIRLKSFSS